jgi:CDP-6-deoxy-D-xylo-4-hexulose-3-dehydrase
MVISIHVGVLSELYVLGYGMFEGMTEDQARKVILDMVASYCEVYHRQKPFEPGQRIPYAARVYDSREMVGLVDSSLEFWLTAGRHAAEFEKDLAAYLGVKHCALVNSGSSANLLAFMALTSPLLGERAIRPGDEVITVAAGFPTTVAPIVQYGAIPVFIDVTIPQYNIDVASLEAALSPKTKAVSLAHTLGNPFDVSAVKAFCSRHGLWLLEDNCDSLGSTYALDGLEALTGTFGDIATSSFYPPHHLTMGEGGAVYSNDPLLSKIVLSLRDWGRDCVCPSGRDNLCGHRFDGRYGQLPLGYDHKYVYSHFGYNLKATDMQAAIGVEQLKKLPSFVEKRRRNFNIIKEALQLANVEDRLVLPEACPGSLPSWFGFLLTCRPPIERDAIVRYLENNGIQTRMLFSGNLLRQPCFGAFRDNGGKYKVLGELPVTDRIMLSSFWVGVYPGLTESMLDYIIKKLLEAIKA